MKDFSGKNVSTQYTDLGRVTEFQYVKLIKEAVQNASLITSLINANMLDSSSALVFVDMPELQRYSDKPLYYRHKESYEKAQVGFIVINIIFCISFVCVL